MEQETLIELTEADLDQNCRRHRDCKIHPAANCKWQGFCQCIRRWCPSRYARLRIAERVCASGSNVKPTWVPGKRRGSPAALSCETDTKPLRQTLGATSLTRGPVLNVEKGPLPDVA